MQDRRKRTRIQGKNWLAVKVLSVPDLEGHAGRTVFCSTRDISSGGIQIASTESIPVGAMVQINLAIAEPVCSFLHVGTVRWAKREETGEHCMGVEFTHTAQEMLEAWHRYVRGRMPHPRKSTGPGKIEE